MIKAVIFTLMGCAIGAITTWLHFYSLDGRNDESNIKYSSLFQLEDRVIPEGKFSCANFKDRKVGTVLARILEQNDRSPLNRITKGCFENKCSVSYGSCMPWQYDSCGSTILYFELNHSEEIVPSSIKCIQVP
jgi:hypothetical protein